MRIGIVGGTGREGSGLAVRWAKAGHDVCIGSRDAARGASVAAALAEAHGVALRGADNEGACADAEVVLMSVPYAGHAAMFEQLAGALEGRIAIDLTIPLKPPKVRSVHLPEGQAAALEAKAIVGDGVRLVAALHHISSDHLGDPEHAFDCDVLVCSDDQDARATVIELVADLGLPGVDAGVLRNAIALESLTPVLLHINRRYGVTGAGIRITGLPREG